MNILLDTHILLWTLNGDPKIPDLAKKYVLDAANTIFYSTVSIWEITIKHQHEPQKMKVTGKEISVLAQEAGFIPVDIYEYQLFQLDSLKRSDNAPVHKDPFDRLLIAQAKTENMILLTHDVLLPFYNEKCIIYV